MKLYPKILSTLMAVCFASALAQPAFAGRRKQIQQDATQSATSAPTNNSSRNIPFWNPGFIATYPGLYESYRIDIVESELLKYFERTDVQDFQWVLESVKSVNDGLRQLNEIANGASHIDPAKDPQVNPTSLSGFAVSMNIKPSDQLESFLRLIYQVRRIRAELDIAIGGIAAVPSILAGKDQTIAAPVHQISIPRLGKLLDFSPLAAHAKAQVEKILAPFQNARWSFLTPKGILALTGIDFQLEPGSVWDSKVVSDLLKKAAVDIQIQASEKRVIDQFNLFRKNLLAGLIQQQGVKQQGLGRVWELDSKGVEQWIGELAQVEFTRSRMRLQYGGFRLGVPRIPELLRENFYLEYLNGTKPLSFVGSEFVRTEAELRAMRNMMFKQLTLAETQAKFGSPVTQQNSFIFSAVSLFNWVRANITGKGLLAKMNAAVLGFLYLDIEEELLAENAGAMQKLKANYIARYITGDPKLDEATRKANRTKAFEWGCYISALSNDSSKACQQASTPQGRNSQSSSNDPFSDTQGLQAANEGSFTSVLQNALLLGFKPWLARRAQANQVYQSAQLILSQTQESKDATSRGNALDDLAAPGR